MATEEFFKLTYPQLTELIRYCNRDTKGRRKSVKNNVVAAGPNVFAKFQEEARKKLEAKKNDN